MWRWGRAEGRAAGIGPTAAKLLLCYTAAIAGNVKDVKELYVIDRIPYWIAAEGVDFAAAGTKWCSENTKRQEGGADCGRSVLGSGRRCRKSAV